MLRYSSLYLAALHCATVPVGGVAVRLYVSPSHIDVASDLAGRAAAAELAVAPILAAAFLIAQEATHVIAEDKEPAGVKGHRARGANNSEKRRPTLQHADAFGVEKPATNDQLPTRVLQDLVGQSFEGRVVPLDLVASRPWHTKAPTTNLGRVHGNQGREIGGQARRNLHDGALVVGGAFAEAHLLEHPAARSGHCRSQVAL